jgi:hypothetical protein
MKNIDLGQALGLLANLGVIAGILLLALEIHQNTESMELQREMALWNISLDAPNLYLNNPDVRRAMIKFNEGQEDLTLEERQLVELNVGRRLQIASFVFRNFPDLVNPRGERCLSSMSSRIREIWDTRKVGLDPGYVQLVESC